MIKPIKVIFFIFILLIIFLGLRMLPNRQKNQSATNISTKQKPASQSTPQWFYPMTNYASRIKYKNFGTYIDENFYEKSPKIFPTHFYGYHAAIDLEVTPEEEKLNIPVYTVTTGKILYIGDVEGYGGIVIQQIDSSHTALYGHIKLSSIILNVGDTVKAGQRICDLGNGFSVETAGERKHLHFAIHKGLDLYFLGHEPTVEVLSAQWENPTKFLQAKDAAEPK